MNTRLPRSSRSLTAAARTALGLAVAYATIAHPSQALAKAFAGTNTVTLTVSASAETAVSFTALPGARCVLGSGARRPLTLYADDNGTIRFDARPTPGGPVSIKLTAACDAQGRHLAVPLELRAVPGVVHNPKPPIVADRTFHLPTGFNALTASDADLQRYGFPPRPERLTSPDAYASWARAVSAATIRVAPTHVLRADRIESNYNNNIWSGIANPGKTGQFNRIEANWYVPSVSAPSSEAPALSSFWVGLDGAGISPDVLQDGTEQDVYAFLGWTFSSYYAWYEFYPDGGSSQMSNISVNPGDEIYAEANSCYDTHHNLLGCYYLIDITQGESQQSYEYPENPSNFKGNTAEYILERPDSGECPLPDYEFATMTGMQAYDTVKKHYEQPLQDSSNTYTIAHGNDTVSAGMYFPGGTSTWFWFNYS